jgi:dCMP deaminase
MIVSRPAWHEIWMTVAKTAATRSLCSRAQIGSVIVTADNRVESITYNGPPPKFEHHRSSCTDWCPRALKSEGFSTEYDDCFANHAEANGIARSNWSNLDGAALYVNGSVCFQCAKLIATTGISTVFHVVNASDAHREPAKVEKFLRRMGIEVVRVAP